MLEEHEEKLLDRMEKLKAHNCGWNHQSATVSVGGRVCVEKPAMNAVNTTVCSVKHWAWLQAPVTPARWRVETGALLELAGHQHSSRLCVRPSLKGIRG